MKNIANITPALAVAIAVAGSAFAPSPKASPAFTTTYLQQDYPGQSTDPFEGNWTDVTAAVDNDPLLYTDEQTNCHWSSTVICVVAYNDGNLGDVYDGISQLF
ncbi:hypothetical protein [Dinghuibacter silviterrae]|uniref:Uncharacterized protein n=1 Tax=Dinghuibacter silviterrae TaxID=1539049 RepID=A0A4R8DI22_9BACT|nr:hypothetical protein [Dinghuibacter silviterrae]TDW96934.1 hypothetical protein EDB95_4770 [Dinghuibacter silviterrae]